MSWQLPVWRSDGSLCFCSNNTKLFWRFFFWRHASSWHENMSKSDSEWIRRTCLDSWFHLNEPWSEKQTFGFIFSVVIATHHHIFLFEVWKHWLEDPSLMSSSLCPICDYCDWTYSRLYTIYRYTSIILSLSSQPAGSCWRRTVHLEKHKSTVPSEVS